ncbi:hypothetical protein Sjap_019523 [Stephania japonica]|uniref:PROP1-like PPR domain-containing protein n=1 Tax=Stephania japonica TaxID=461633 RepID=A0AAP0HZT3_9MAGN
MLMGGGGSFSAGGPGKGMHSHLRVLNENPAMQSFSAFSSLYNNTGLFGIHATTKYKFWICVAVHHKKIHVALITSGEWEPVRTCQTPRLNCHVCVQMHSGSEVRDKTTYESHVVRSTIEIQNRGNSLKLQHLGKSTKSAVLMNLESRILAVRLLRVVAYMFRLSYKHNLFSANKLLVKLSKSTSTSAPNSITLISSLLDDMDRLSIKGSISTVNILIGVVGSGSGGCGVVELERWLGLVAKWGLTFTAYTYKCLVQAWLRLGDTERAFGVYCQMKGRGYGLDVFGFNMLLDSLAKGEKVEQAYKVFGDMKRKHCEPDEYTYTIMIRMCGKSGKADEALKFFQEMLSKGCAPNLIAYNTLIQALARNGMVDKLIFVFSKMVENDCRPNEFTYSVILDALVTEGKLGRLDEVLQISKRFLNRSIYAYLVNTLNRLGHASEAHRLFCSMWNFHDKGDRDACLSVLDRLCSAGKTVEAIDLLTKINEKGISADTIMYNMVFSALGKSKQISHIHDLYLQMKRDGPSPDMFTYNILISCFGRVGQVEDAVRLFEEMDDGDCKPDVITYNSLINCLGKNGDLDEAHMRFMEMKEKGLNPDVITYSTLIECFGKTSRVEMALSLFNQMLAEGCFPNTVTYNILLDCLDKCGKTTEALELYTKMKQQGLTPDSITYAVLERLQSGSHKAVRIRRQNPITGWVGICLVEQVWV